MDQPTASLLLYGITAIAAVAWLMGARFLGRSFRAEPSRGKGPPDPFEMAERSSSNLVRGSVEIEGTPEDLAVRATSVLAESGAGGLGPLKIVESAGGRLVVEGSGEASGPQATARFLRLATLDFRRAGGRHTRVDYEIEVASGRGLRLGGAVFLILGLVAIVVGFATIHTYVVPNANPGVRAQTIQMVQVVHFLWPPFLFGGLYRRGRNALREAFEVMINNLPYHGGR